MNEIRLELGSYRRWLNDSLGWDPSVKVVVGIGWMGIYDHWPLVLLHAGDAMTDLSNAEKRAIWEDCYAWVQSQKVIYPQDPALEALRRYPDPKEPTIVTDLDGVQYSFRRTPQGNTMLHQRQGSGVEKWEMTVSLSYRILTPSFILALAEIAQESLTNTQDKQHGRS